MLTPTPRSMHEVGHAHEFGRGTVSVRHLSCCARIIWIVAQALALSAAGSAVSADEPFPAELTDWVPSPAEPVFSGRGEGHWDAMIRERGWILRDGETWHLWYTGYDGTPNGIRRLGHAVSSDGIGWKRTTDAAPLLPDLWVEDMMVVVNGDDWYMFAEGRDDQAQLLHRTADRADWERIGALDVRLTNGNPIPAGPYGTPTAWFEDGTWYLFYERRDAGIWLATSPDLVKWINVSDDPVIVPGPGRYDQLMIAMNQIIKQDGRYYATYHGTGSPQKPRDWCSAIAVSDDLTHWAKYDGNPLRPPSENKSSNIVVRDEEGRFIMFTMHGEIVRHVPLPQQAQGASGGK